jgi:hypothetical protein
MKEESCIYNVRIRTVNVDILLTEESSVLCGERVQQVQEKGK